MSAILDAFIKDVKRIRENYTADVAEFCEFELPVETLYLIADAVAALRETVSQQAVTIEAQTELLDEACREVFEFRNFPLSDDLSVRLINRYHARHKAQEPTA